MLSAYVLVMILTTFDGAAGSVAIDMPDAATCELVRQNESHDVSVKRAFCVRRDYGQPK